MHKYSLGEIRKMAKTENEKISVENLFLREINASYQEFVDLVHRGLDWVCQEIARDPQHWSGSEDDITIRLIGRLKDLAFDAKHDQKIGGHCDIIIEFLGTYLWLGEAKKVETADSNHINGGFLQLTSRYCTGRPEHSQGGLIIYCVGSRSDKILGRWKEYFQDRYRDHEILEIRNNEFWSRHEHERTGEPITLRHLTVSLQFEPKDK